MSDEYSFTLSPNDYDLLLIMLGYAVGAAAERKDRHVLRIFLRLTNEINKNNPNFRPYELPPEGAEPDV